MSQITVILSARPNEPEFTRRQLDSLRDQTLPAAQWELVVPCVGGRPIYEKESIRSSGLRTKEMDFPNANAVEVWSQVSRAIQSEVFVFVSQRTLLDPDYLENALHIADQHSWLGVWGGDVRPDENYVLPEWIRGEPWLVGCQPVTADRWANTHRGYELGEAFPYCGPLCLRASAAGEWAQLRASNGLAALAGVPAEASELRARLEFVFALHHLRWGTGLFQSLRATQIVRPEETDLAALARELEEIEFTRWSMLKCWGWAGQIPLPSGTSGILGWLRRRLTWKSDQRRLFTARLQGRERAERAAQPFSTIQADSPPCQGEKTGLGGNGSVRDENPLPTIENAGNCLMSVVICTYNPRKDILERTLKALAVQTLSPEHWELLIIDNNSDEPVAPWLKAPWHKSFRVIEEPQQGIDLARTCGLRKARGELILFVDDDNVLDADYLATALRIGRDHPRLGVWGGVIELEFEVSPPSWIDMYRPLLAERRLGTDQWSNLTFDCDCTPVTAGLCLRREVAQAFIQRMSNLPPELRLGRRGLQLTNCEDLDLAWTACKHGWGMGMFRDLRLVHLIPPQRLEKDYLLRLQEGTSYSFVILYALWGDKLRISPSETCARWIQIFSERDPVRQAFLKASFVGQKRGYRWLATGRIRQLMADASFSQPALHDCNEDLKARPLVVK